MNDRQYFEPRKENLQLTIENLSRPVFLFDWPWLFYFSHWRYIIETVKKQHSWVTNWRMIYFVKSRMKKSTDSWFVCQTSAIGCHSFPSSFRLTYVIYIRQ